MNAPLVIPILGVILMYWCYCVWVYVEAVVLTELHIVQDALLPLGLLAYAKIWLRGLVRSLGALRSVIVPEALDRVGLILPLAQIRLHI